MLRRISIALFRSYLKSAQNMFYAIYSGILNPEENPHGDDAPSERGTVYERAGISKVI